MYDLSFHLSNLATRPSVYTHPAAKDSRLCTSGKCADTQCLTSPPPPSGSMLKANIHWLGESFAKCMSRPTLERGGGGQRRQQVYANSNTLVYTWGVHGILAMIVEKIKKILEDLLENIIKSRHFITIFHKNSGARYVTYLQQSVFDMLDSRNIIVLGFEPFLYPSPLPQLSFTNKSKTLPTIS